MLARLESRFGRYAISDIIRYIIMLNALVYVLQLISPGYTAALELHPDQVYAGEIWRIFTWIFIPRAMSPIWMLFALLFFWFLGDLIESAWSSFQVNAFYISGWFLTTVGVFLFPQSGISSSANEFLNLTILFAAATLQPNYQILLFFIIPLKLKWLGLFSGVLSLLLFIGASISGKICIFLSFANYFIFFGPSFFRQQVENRTQAQRRARFEAAMEGSDTLHRCVVCGRTEISHPDLEFRVRVDGKEYCLEHLNTPDKKEE